MLKYFKTLGILDEMLALHFAYSCSNLYGCW